VNVNGPRPAAVCASDATTWEAGITTARNSGAKRALTSASRSRAAPPLSWSSVQRTCRPTAVAGGLRRGRRGQGVAGVDAPASAQLDEREASAARLREPRRRSVAVDVDVERVVGRPVQPGAIEPRRARLDRLRTVTAPRRECELGAGTGAVAVRQRPKVRAGRHADLPLVGAGFDRASGRAGGDECEGGLGEHAASDTAHVCQSSGHTPTVRARRPPAIGRTSDLALLLGHGLATSSSLNEGRSAVRHPAWA
jgi:hypothetical protein